ncbi:MAG: hypothetical protein QOE33_3664 [Acidobacteriota bacterium]|nr:hypothetical protein [Acidobacteriota bacterium]
MYIVKLIQYPHGDVREGLQPLQLVCNKAREIVVLSGQVTRPSREREVVVVVLGG